MDNKRWQIIQMRISFRFVFFSHSLSVFLGYLLEFSSVCRRPHSCVHSPTNGRKQLISRCCRIKDEINVMRDGEDTPRNCTKYILNMDSVSTSATGFAVPVLQVNMPASRWQNQKNRRTLCSSSVRRHRHCRSRSTQTCLTIDSENLD